MRKFRRFAALVMGMAMAGALLGGCSGAPKQEGKQETKQEEKQEEAAKAEDSGTEKEDPAAQEQEGSSSVSLEGVRIIHLISNTRGDGGNHDMAAKAVEKMRDEYGAEIKIVEMGNSSADVAKYLPTTLDACEDGWKYVVCGSAQMVEPVQEAAKEYPEVKFIVYDAEITRSQEGELANVYSALFKQNESSYLAGILAMGMSDTGKVGFIGGQEIPTINDFLVGYIAGARSVKEDAVVYNSFIGSWNDLAKAKELADIQYQQGASLIFPAAGQAYAGIYEAGFELQKMYLGCDVDRTLQYESNNPEMNNYMPTSVIKRVDTFVENSFQRIMAGENIFGIHEAVGLKEDCVGLVENGYYEKLVPEDVKKQVEEARSQIVDGTIQVPSAFGMDQNQLNEFIGDNH
ncbi:MAG: BMP family ABC transporter substrate-binding protein [Lachnospiraceae bacterium]|nr:BMP family ABC transporter substrate-binding protein [Lachnospiraceae bacterium]